jgi:4-amino-4-deoxy-L-arabinose transferase-like glycosyltransferase
LTLAQEALRLTTAERESAAPHGGLLALAVPLLHLLWLPLALAFIGLFAYAVTARLGYPYPLEWLEPATTDTVSRILRGLPIYCAPSYDFVPSMKTPLYYYVVAAFSPIFGADLVAGRLVSILSTAGICLFVWRFIRREDGSRSWALFGVALFLATFNIARQWYDIARLDALFLFNLVAAAYALRFWRRAAGAIGAGFLLAAAYFTKQTVLLAATPLLLALAPAAPRRALVAALAFAVPVVVGMAVLHVSTDGWSTFFLVEVPRHGEIDRSVIASFWTTDLLPPLGLALLTSLALVIAKWGCDREGALFYGGLLSGALLCSWLGRIHVGSTSNALMPIFAVLALMMPLALQRLLQNAARRPPRPLLSLVIHAVALLQLALLAYDPRGIIPDASDRQAAEQVRSFLGRTDGDVLVMDRFFSRAAGKPSSGLDFSVADLLRVKHSPVPDDFKRSVIDALHAGKFVGVIDPPDFVIDAVKLGPPVSIQVPPQTPDHIHFRPRPERFYAVLQ